MTHAEIREWFDLMKIINYTIRFNGIVDVSGGVDLRSFKVATFPVQFGHIGGYFYCDGGNILSLQGAPQSVDGYFYCNDSSITSLEYAPQSVGSSFYCARTKIISLHNIHNQIKHIDGTFFGGYAATHLLGLLLIDGITKFNIDNDGPIDAIFNKYRGTGDILSAQDELIDAGFIEQARL